MKTLHQANQLELQSFRELLESSFLSTTFSYLKDFPIWDPEIQVQDRYQIFLGPPFSPHLNAPAPPLVIATASARLAPLYLTDHLRCPVLLIGAIATHPKYQGQGYALRLLQELKKWGVQKDAQLAFLWGRFSKLYQSQGFQPIGLQSAIPLSLFLNHFHFHQDLLETKGIKLVDGWHTCFLTHFQQRTCGLLRTEDDLPWLSKQGSVGWLSLWKDETLLAGIAYNRGMDLSQMVHEWFGDPESVLFLIKTIMENSEALKTSGTILISRIQIAFFKQNLLKKTDLIEPYQIGPIALGCDLRKGNFEKKFSSFTLNSLDHLCFWGLDAV